MLNFNKKLKISHSAFKPHFAAVNTFSKPMTAAFNFPKAPKFSDILNNRTPSMDMTSMNKFTPFGQHEKAYDMTAARRLGGQNLKGLQLLGHGRDRDVYALDDDKVIKIARNPGGLTQNTAESDLVYLDMGEQLEAGKDYVVMKRQQPLSLKGKRKLAKVRKTYEEEYNSNGRNIVNEYGRSEAPIQLVRHSEKFSGDNSVLDEVGIGRDVLDYDFNPNELFANRQWGEDEEGNLVLLDGGALQNSNSLSRYRVKDFQQVANMDKSKPEPWQLTDWKDVQYQRKAYKDKGNYSPEEKEYSFNRPEYEGPIPDEPFDDEESKNYIRIMNVGEDVYDYTNERFDGEYPPKVRVYHGTTKELAKNIKQHGLLPQSSTGVVNYGRISGKYKGNVFVTQNKSDAGFWARQHISNGEPVIIEADIPYEEYEMGLQRYTERYGEDPMVQDESRDELVLNSIPAKNIKKITPVTSALIVKDYRTNSYIHGNLAHSREQRDAEEKFSIMFNDLTDDNKSKNLEYYEHYDSFYTPSVRTVLRQPKRKKPRVVLKRRNYTMRNPERTTSEYNPIILNPSTDMSFGYGFGEEPKKLTTPEIFESSAYDMSDEEKDRLYMMMDDEPQYTKDDMNQARLFLRDKPALRKRFGTRNLELQNEIARSISRGEDPAMIDWESLDSTIPFGESLESERIVDDDYGRNKIMYVPNSSIMDEYSSNPTKKRGNLDVGRCHDAASCLVTDAIKQGVPEEDISVVGVRAPNLTKGERIHSSHIIANIQGKYYDPTKTQFGYGETELISDEPDERYHSPVEQNIRAYIKRDDK